MKYIVTTLRILVGLLFIFSGLIKANDPTGFSYKLDEYFSVFADDLEAEQDSLTLSVTTLDGVNTFTFGLNPSNTELQIVSTSSDWIEIPTGDSMPVYLSTAEIKFAGTSVYSAEINAEDTGALIEEVKLSVQLQDKELLNSTVAFKGFVSNNQIETVNTQEYVKENSWLVGLMEGMRKYALALAIFVCIVEIVLGIALLIGWAPKFTVAMLLLMLLFFAFLTFYSAQYNKVTDCGCFGDAIKLTPWQSFNKDLILLIAVVIIGIWIKYLRPLFSNPFSVRLLTVCALLSCSFSVYCWHYLPVKNFLKFKEGVDIRKEMKVKEGGRETDHVIREYIYDNNGEQVIVVWDSEDNSFTPSIDKAWKFVDVGEEKILEKRDEPNIHDFKIMDETQNNDYVEDFFTSSKYKILIVINDVDEANLKAMPKIKELITAWKEAGYEVYPLTASEVSKVEEFRHEHQLDVPFYYGDKTNLKSIIRSNPGLLLIDSSTVVKTWPSTRLPKAKKLLKLTE